MSNSLRVEHLQLSNFRAFKLLEVDLHPELTVLVARNGMGKTAVLDALALALMRVGHSVLGMPNFQPIDPTDVRRALAPTGAMVEQSPTWVRARGLLDGRSIEWGPVVANVFGVMDGSSGDPLQVFGAQLRAHLQDYADRRRPDPPILPVLSYYRAERRADDGPRRLRVRRLVPKPEPEEPGLDNPLNAYLGSLNTGLNYSNFKRWFKAVVRESLNESQGGQASIHRPQALLAAVRAATDTVLAPSGWGRLNWDFVADSLIAEHPTAGRLPVSLLSDGVRNLLVLVADIAHRCARLNPHLGADAPRQTPGWVLIDEVELHLHPGWQPFILPLLREAFPQVQLVVTTHSPQVLSTTPAACIRILEPSANGDIQVRHPAHQTEGVPAQDVMAAVMGVDSVPDVPIRRDLHAYQALIQQGRHETAEGAELRAKLEAHFGIRHPEIADLDRLIRFYRMKTRVARETP